jgi:hypothetical protein
MGAGGQPQKVECGLTVLRMNHHGKYRKQNGQYKTLHFLFFYLLPFLLSLNSGTKVQNMPRNSSFITIIFCFYFLLSALFRIFAPHLWKRRKVERLIWSTDGYAGSFWDL